MAPTLHPVALRTTAKASSSRSVAASLRAEAALRDQHQHDLPVPAPKPSANAPSSTPSAAPMGLGPAPTSLPTLTLRSVTGVSPTDISLLTAREYVDMHTRYLHSTPHVDESMVFPWLHCCDQPGTPQAAYFGSRAKDPPRYRGLTVVTADPRPGQRRASVLSSASISTAGGRPRTNSAGSRSTASSASLESAVSSLFDGSLTLDPSSPQGADSPSSPTSLSLNTAEPHASLLTSSVFPEDILVTNFESGNLEAQFLNRKLPPNVNLRLFKHQPAKYATVSDIVVYAEQGLCQASVSLAEKIREAQKTVYMQRGGHVGGAIEYHTFIISDKFETIEEQFPDYIAVDGWGWRRNKVDFVQREREEMCALTKASEIAHNVWLGNSSDVPVMPRDSTRPHRVTTSESSSSLSTTISHVDDGNVHGFALCIEAHDLAKMPSPFLLSSQSMHFNQLEEQLSPNDVIEDQQGDRVLRPSLEDVAHMEVVSSGQVCYNATQKEELIERMIELCMWLHKIVRGKPGQLGKRVLVYCHDGYTESSFFALAYTMWERQCSLPDAYLHLQLERSRSFFVYPADAVLLQRIEAKMESVRKMERMDIEEVATASTTPIQTPRRTFLGGRVAFGLITQKPSPNSPTSEACASPTGSVTPLSSRERHPWFYDYRFDGHFPSRILPHVYLGNLNHASNALMLNALGITHVVSIGESALASPRVPYVPVPHRRAGFNAQSASSSNSLWTEWKAGRIQVLDMKGVADDGVDSIKPHMDRALKFMEECRLEGGKVLVHCRVGVSRSASIVIAYVMQYLKMDLVSAYLMVRSRRLNILIQPNLLFMWALKRWEAELVIPTKDDDEEQTEGKKRRGAKMLTWSHFAKEVADLNERYLC